jgi:hypothetical protein
MKLSRMTICTSAVAVLAAGVALWPANAQPTDKPGQPPAAGQPGEQPGRGRGRAPGDGAQPPGSEWRDKYADTLKDHPELGRALISLHMAKDYIDKATTDLGGHKASSIKALDAAIAELEAAVKADPKHEAQRPAGRRPGRGGGGGDGGPGPSGGETKPPADSKP